MSVEFAGEAVPGFTLTPLSRISARRVDYDWAWARDNVEAIERNWERRRAKTPGLFDGPVFLASIEQRVRRFLGSVGSQAPQSPSPRGTPPDDPLPRITTSKLMRVWVSGQRGRRRPRS